MPTPLSVRLVCHGCLDKVAMVPNGNWIRPLTGLYVADYSCPSCNTVCKLTFASGTKDVAWQPDRDPEVALYQHPTPKGLREPNAEFLDEATVPKHIGRAYEKAVNVFSTDHTASAVLTRRTLEAIAVHYVPNASRSTPLSKLLQSLPPDLGSAVAKMGHALREGGNLAAHFNSEDDVSVETAAAMLEMLEDLIEYLFVLPKKIEKLQERLAAKAG